MNDRAVEYRLIRATSPEDLEKRLTQASAERWEALSIAVMFETQLVALLKRAA